MDLHKFVESLNHVEKQTLKNILENEDHRISVIEWLDANDDLPKRATNPLRFYLRDSFMDELTINQLKKLRNLGINGLNAIIERYPMPEY
jgi:hypothetical protein